MAAVTLTAGLACGDDVAGPSLTLVDFHRHARFTAAGDALVYYRHDERPGAAVGIFHLDPASGTHRLVINAIIAGLDLHPASDRVVFSAEAVGESEPDLWVINLDGTGLIRLTTSAEGERWPAWSADGQRLAWEVRRTGQQGLDTVNTLWIGDWADSAIVGGRAIAPGRRSAWRPDGGALVVEQRRPAGAVPPVIAVVDTSGQLLDTLGFGSEPIWSPDGAEVAYLADREADRGCRGVCFVPAAGGTPRALATAFESFMGSWSRDGREFIYARLMRTYALTDATVAESRLWIRTLATGAERQVTF